MELLNTNSAQKPASGLASLIRLLIFAVLLPAIVAGTNQWIFNAIPFSPWLQPWLYPWMAASTAVISWCSGRYLSPAWLGWIIFGWCLVLLDLLTFIACIDGRLEDQYGYVLISAQIALLVLWAILGPGAWQLRLPAVAAVAPLVMIFSGSFVGWQGWYTRTWNMMMLLTAFIIALLCGGLRYLGFSLQILSPQGASEAEIAKRPSYQFGTKHMLIWLTVTGPLLLFVRSIDFAGSGFFPAALLAMSVATVNLIAIWAILGGGHWVVRVISLLGIPFLIAQGMAYYSTYLKAGAGTMRWNRLYGTTAWTIGEMEDLWLVWLWLDAALLAALLLFLRAGGYRLLRSKHPTAGRR